MSDPQSGFGYPRQQSPQDPYRGASQQDPHGPAQRNPHEVPAQDPNGGYGYGGPPPHVAGAQAWSPAAAPGYYPRPAPRRRGLSTGGVLAIVFGSVGLLLVAGVVLVAIVIAGVIQGETSRPAAAPTSDSSTGAYDLVERPAYAAYVTRVKEMTKKYSDARADGSIHQWVPATQAGDDYATAFVYILTDKEGATLFAATGITTDDDPAVLDAMIAADDADLTELERRFLAGEALGTKVTITRPNGSTFSYDGNAGPNG
ncbi:hypothetical protein GCM10027515_31770 [Schumannella luteola]|uniref:Uncharacterized protein n=1 Tax=Schumannella luteola TaxID=472059 RepID=A0A852Y9C1_9MICO|nr:hypothetical protein [Schumannella luteola]NYG99023.1 hypothetical protein [Schumannella luteola]TPX06381.1 hypothetical protein FJ656_01740 [Schumannella luteola]